MSQFWYQNCNVIMVCWYWHFMYIAMRFNGKHKIFLMNSHKLYIIEKRMSCSKQDLLGFIWILMIIMIPQILIIFPFVKNHKCRPHSCPCRQQRVCYLLYGSENDNNWDSNQCQLKWLHLVRHVNGFLSVWFCCFQTFFKTISKTHWINT